jgi:hypothetical protein
MKKSDMELARATQAAIDRKVRSDLIISNMQLPTGSKAASDNLSATDSQLKLEQDRELATKRIVMKGKERYNSEFKNDCIDCRESQTKLCKLHVEMKMVKAGLIPPYDTSRCGPYVDVINKPLANIMRQGLIENFQIGRFCVECGASPANSFQGKFLCKLHREISLTNSQATPNILTNGLSKPRPDCCRTENLIPFTHPLTGETLPVCRVWAKRFLENMARSDMELARATQAGMNRQEVTSRISNIEIKIYGEKGDFVYTVKDKCIECGNPPTSSISGIFFCKQHLDQQLQMNGITNNEMTKVLNGRSIIETSSNDTLASLIEKQELVERDKEEWIYAQRMLRKFRKNFKNPIEQDQMLMFFRK